MFPKNVIQEDPDDEFFDQLCAKYSQSLGASFEHIAEKFCRDVMPQVVEGLRMGLDCEKIVDLFNGDAVRLGALDSNVLAICGGVELTLHA
jgi:hypothetical protein